MRRKTRLLEPILVILGLDNNHDMRIPLTSWAQGYSKLLATDSGDLSDLGHDCTLTPLSCNRLFICDTRLAISTSDIIPSSVPAV